MRPQSRALSSGDVYHNKVKIPEGYVNGSHVPPCRNNLFQKGDVFCILARVFSALKKYINLLDRG